MTRLPKFKKWKKDIRPHTAIIIIMGLLQSTSCCLLPCVCVYGVCVQVSLVSTLLSPLYLMDSYKCKINITAVRRKNLPECQLDSRCHFIRSCNPRDFHHVRSNAIHYWTARGSLLVRLHVSARKQAEEVWHVCHFWPGLNLL